MDVGKADSVERLRMNHGPHLESDMEIVPVGKTKAAIRIPVPKMDTAAPFEMQIKDARQAMEAVLRLYRQSAMIAGDRPSGESAGTKTSYEDGG